jgi:hypothetical protein
MRLSLYARDPIGETSTKVLINATTKLGSSRPYGHREVFHLGGTVWENGKNLSHIFVTRISRERLCYY